MLVKTNIITWEQFLLDFNKKTAFIESYFCLFNLNIETPQYIIQLLIYVEIRTTILTYTKAIVPIYYLNILNSWDFFFQLHDVSFAFSFYLININMVGFLVENNINKPIYIFQNCCLDQI